MSTNDPFRPCDRCARLNFALGKWLSYAEAVCDGDRPDETLTRRFEEAVAASSSTRQPHNVEEPKGFRVMVETTQGNERTTLTMTGEDAERWINYVKAASASLPPCESSWTKTVRKIGKVGDNCDCEVNSPHCPNCWGH